MSFFYSKYSNNLRHMHVYNLRWLPTLVPLGHWYLANPVERENCVGKCKCEKFACKFPHKM